MSELIQTTGPGRVFDTSAIINIWRGQREVRVLLEEASPAVIPAIVLGELTDGAYRSGQFVRHLRLIDELHGSSEIAPVDAHVARLYGRLRAALARAGTPIPENDIWIAATAVQLQLPLVTSDAHFDRIPRRHADPLLSVRRIIDTMPDTPDPANTLYLIDGHAQIFRAYYAIRGGMNSPVTGEPTHATFAFTGMLLKLLTQFTPHYVAMAIDSEGPTFRDDIFPDYKANREAPPDDFAAQIPRIFEITRLFGIPILEKPGAEADDILATCVQKMRDDGHAEQFTIRLVSKDKDLEQLLDERTCLFDIHTDATLDLAGFREKRGIEPHQVVDLLSLTGDTSDNIPGVQGIGAKTAAKLLQEYGSIEKLLESLDQIKGKRKENLEAAREQLPVNRELVTLKRDVDVVFSLEAAKLGAVEGDKLREIFRQLGFNRHITDLDKLLKAPAASSPPEGAPQRRREGKSAAADAVGTLFDTSTPATEPAKPADLAGDYRTILTRDELSDLVQTLAKQDVIAVDTETVGLGSSKDLCGICLAWKTGCGAYIPVCSPEPEKHLTLDDVISALRAVLESDRAIKVAHNLKYDYSVLRRAGITLRGAMFDTMIAAFLLGKPGRGLDHLAMSELGYTMIPITDLIGAKPSRKADPPQKTMDQVALEHAAPYGAEDADITLRLYELFRPQIESAEMQRLCDDVEMPLVQVLADMEDAGIRCDPAVLDEQRDELQQRIDTLRREILDAARSDFNPDSPKQLGDVLFNQLCFPVIKKTRTGYSTDSEVLEKLADRDDLEKVPDHARGLPGLVLEYRMLTKLVGTYLVSLKEAIADDGRIHANFVQTGAATGRLSSNGPNLQNIPIRTDVGRQIRRAFVAEPGHRLIAADYSQIELRMLAHLAEDEALIEAFTSGQDIHTAVASQVFGVEPETVTPTQRTHAKTINFGIIYGVTPFGLARRIENLDQDGAKQLIDDYKTRFAGIDRFMNECVLQAQTHGYVTTMLGRRRPIPEVNATHRQQKALGERLAINTVVQGSAADLIKLAMVNLHRRIADEQLPMRMLLQIHDELVVEAPEAKADAMGQIVRETMEFAMDLKVPLQVEVGIAESWYDAK